MAQPRLPLEMTTSHMTSRRVGMAVTGSREGTSASVEMPVYSFGRTTSHYKEQFRYKKLMPCRCHSLLVYLSPTSLSLSLSPLQLESSKLTWVTGIAIMPNVNKLMLSFTDNMLSLYDLSSSHCDRLFQIVSLPYCVLNMDYW